MDNNKTIIEQTEAYLKTRYNLLMLNTVDKVSDVLSLVIYHVAFYVALAIFTLFINIGIALYLGNVLDNNYWGFIIVSVFYLIIAICLKIFKVKLIVNPLNELLINKMLKKVNIDDIINE